MKVPSSQAKNILGELVRRAEIGEVVEFTRYGDTTTYLISKERWDRMNRALFSSPDSDR